MSNNKKTEAGDKEVAVVEAKATQEKSASESSSSVKNKTDSSKARKTVNKPENASSNRSKSSGRFIFLFQIIIVAAIAAASYYFWELQQKQNRFIEQQARSINSLQSEVKKISSELDSGSELDVAHSKQLQQLSEQISQTEEISQQAIEIVNRSRREWALSEIDYLLRMAHRRVEVARDIGGAIAALKGADTRIKELADLNLFKIRKQIAEDIAGLNAIHQADINGISLAIDGMITYLSDLPFKSVKEEIEAQLEDAKELNAVPEGEQTFVDSVIETVKKIGDIEIYQGEVQAESSVQQQNQIEQILRTHLLSSRLAALRFNQIQFLREVQQAREILHIHYDTNDNRVQQLEKTLNDFSALQLSPDLPELTRAWSILQNEIKKIEADSSPESKKTSSQKMIRKDLKPIKINSLKDPQIKETDGIEVQVGKLDKQQAQKVDK